MGTFTKLVLGTVGALRPAPATGEAAERIELPPPEREVDFALMQALDQRHSTREFRSDPLPLQVLSDLLWAADGTNREGEGRTVPAAQNVHDLIVYAALPQGAYRYDPKAHELVLVAPADLRRVTGYQDFVDHAPLDLVYVADTGSVAPMTAGQRESFAWVEAGAIAQNVYLYCAAYGLGTVLRAWLDRDAVGHALGLHAHQQVLLSQTVGYPAG